ncbi:hypothetical protein JQ596_20755 [Bradyrhizobium manausense]|uniref:hypothetical protein n=1 Tax=Bradyrhizobium TaxID=374 RepID=UPI001BAB52C3|nr:MULTISPECIES: hypothetical protein [Bradyrhizobium]MBR0827968.1 hypothetical protein [Bradyrhizobium manausense]UVO32837.1 hypothetical protein KUF59_20555 [Bradyrhizobium arachidis]
MGNRTAKFISALFASVLAGAPLSAVSQNAPSTEAAPTAANDAAANAADDCLVSPKKTAPEGQHWYYRVERGTKRQCWYLRAEGTKSAQSTQTTAASQKPETPAPRSMQDARAEWPTPQGTVAQDTTASILAPKATASQPLNQRLSASADSAEQPALNARWPDASAATAPAPQPAAAPATKLADARPAPEPAPEPATAPAVTAPATPAPADKPTGSLQTLLLVIGGALTLAGILGSAIYRFAGSGARVRAHDGTRRRVNWEPPADNARAPWAEAAAPRLQRLKQLKQQQQPQPFDFSFALPQPQRDAAPATEAADVRVVGDAVPAAENDIHATDEAEAAAIAFDDVSPEPEAETIEARAETEKTDDADTVDIDIITKMLERLAKEGPRLTQTSPEADLADLVRIQRGQSAVRA